MILTVIICVAWNLLTVRSSDEGCTHSQTRYTVDYLCDSAATGHV